MGFNLEKTFIDGYEFMGRSYLTFSELAQALAKNWALALDEVESGRLLNEIGRIDENLFTYLEKNCLSFDILDSKLSFILYCLDSDFGLCYKGKYFKSTADIAKLIGKTYPEINNDVFDMLKDRLLSKAQQVVYETDKVDSNRRLLDFLRKVENSCDYDFIYYYFFYSHLDRNKRDYFLFHDKKIYKLDDAIDFLLANKKYARNYVLELLDNPIFLAKMAIEIRLEAIRSFLDSEYEDVFFHFIMLLQEFTNKNLVILLDNGINLWLLDNYLSYRFIGYEAEMLRKDYDRVPRLDSLESIDEVFGFYENAINLYQRFAKLFNKNLLYTATTEGIFADELEYYLGFETEGELVCEKYLKEEGKYNASLYSIDNLYEAEKNRLLSIIDNRKNDLKTFEKKIVFMKKEPVISKKNNLKMLFSTLFNAILVILATYLINLNHASISKIAMTIIMIIDGILVALILTLLIRILFHLRQITMKNGVYHYIKKTYTKINRDNINIVNFQSRGVEDIFLRKKKRSLDGKIHVNSYEIDISKEKYYENLFKTDEVILRPRFEEIVNGYLLGLFLVIDLVAIFRIANITSISFNYLLLFGLVPTSILSILMFVKKKISSKLSWLVGLSSMIIIGLILFFIG